MRARASMPIGQLDNEFIQLTSPDGSGGSISQGQTTRGALEAAFLEDQYKPTTWLTLTGGVRLTHFSGAISENAADPRVGVAIRIPHLNWVARGFFGRYYQPPPLSTVSGPLLGLAVTQGLGFIPLPGERNQEYQVGLAIPVRRLDVRRQPLPATGAQLLRSQLHRKLERILPFDDCGRQDHRVGIHGQVAAHRPACRVVGGVCVFALPGAGGGHRRAH